MRCSPIRDVIADKPVAMIFLCFVFSLLCLADSQAPGDGDEVCINDPQHPVYDDYVHPLMDTRDYIQLLPNSEGIDGVWQALDKDENNPPGRPTEWRDSKGTCVNAPRVCGYEEGPQNNWIISQHISRQVPAIKIMFDLSITNSCPSCEEALSLYVWETSTPNATSAADTDNYHFTTNLYSGVQRLTIDFSSSHHTGFYLGIRDNGTCATVNRVLVYITCVTATVGLVHVTVSNSSSVVQGECVADSVAIHEEGPLVVCSEKGEWSIVSGCECITQHYMDSSGQQCFDCPSNSEATQTGLTECPCVQDYYRADSEAPATACTQSPSAPVNVTTSNVTNTSATLFWLPPEYSGGRNTSEITYTITYSASHSSVEVETISGVTTTEIELTDLVPFLNYIFSVTAENAVSYQDTNINARTSSTAAFTLEGVAAMVYGLKITVGDYVTLSWPPPDPPHGVIQFYNIKITNQNNMNTTLLVGYTQTSIPKSVLTQSMNVTNGAVIAVQVQAVTRVGAGEYSKPLSFVVSVKFNSTSITSKSYELAVILVSSLVPGLVLLIILIVLLVLVVMKCRKKPSLLHTQTISDEEIVEYASTPITKIGKFTLAPPLPCKSPPSLQISPNLAYASAQFTASEANTYNRSTSSGSGDGVEGDPLDSDGHSDEVINDSYGETI